MQWRIQGRGPGGPTPAYFQSKLGPEGPKPKKHFLETSPPPPPLSNGLEDRPPPLLSRSGSGDSMLRWHPGGEGGGGGTPIHYIIIRVSAAQRGCDFEASDLGRCIHFRGVF